jgi:hypothetical protein
MKFHEDFALMNSLMISAVIFFGLVLFGLVFFFIFLRKPILKCPKCGEVIENNPKANPVFVGCKNKKCKGLH